MVRRFSTILLVRIIAKGKAWPTTCSWEREVRKTFRGNNWKNYITFYSFLAPDCTNSKWFNVHWGLYITNFWRVTNLSVVFVICLTRHLCFIQCSNLKIIWACGPNILKKAKKKKRHQNLSYRRTYWRTYPRVLEDLPEDFEQFFNLWFPPEIT